MVQWHCMLKAWGPILNTIGGKRNSFNLLLGGVGYGGWWHPKCARAQGSALVLE